MSTTKRPRTTAKKKEPAKATSKARVGARGRAASDEDEDEDEDDIDDESEPEASPRGRTSRAAAKPSPVKATKTDKADKPDKPERRAAKAAPAARDADEDAGTDTDEAADPKPEPKAAAAAPARGRGRRTSKAAEAPPRPPSPSYTLDGPVPPEGAGLPPKVGALLGIGQQAFGIKQYRPGQAEAFAHLLDGEDLLAVMPTGSGKSLLYQLPSLILPGVTVVVSPLIALIKDQIDKMVARGVHAMRIDSTLTVRQRREVDAMVREPGGKLLLTTPERMADPEFRVFLREASSGVGVSRFVVDEAHCVSQWGHDFRPAYLSLRKALEDVGRPPVLATTATAPPHVRDDILFQLGMEGATTVTTTFDRPNLHYEVIIFSDEDEKMKTLVTLLKKLPRPGIVYCATVKKVEELYEALTRWGVQVGKYHGRMNKGERDASQNAFMESSELVMVATNAFGLGVDKPNIRNVLHYHVPGSLESYAQEAGRGGRDGKPARCVLLFSPDDVAIQEYFLSGTYPTKRQVRQVFEAVEAFTNVHRGGGKLAEESPPNVANIALSSGVGQQRTRTVLSLLKDEQFIVEREGGTYFLADPPQEEELLLERAKQYEARRIMDRQRLDALLAYVKAPGCRNQVILSYLGESDPPKCGRCDNCLRSREAALAASTEATRLGLSLTQRLDFDDVGEAKPKREIKARIVRIDQPPVAQGSGPASSSEVPEAPARSSSLPANSTPAAAAAPARPATVLRRSAASAAAPTAKQAAAPAPAPPAPSARSQTNGRSIAHEPRADAAMASRAAESTEPVVAKRQEAPRGPDGSEVDDDELEDDDALLDDDEDEEDAEGEDGELVDEDEDFDDDDLDDDEDDDDLDDDEDDDLDDDEDDDDYEVIDKTAAELAEEGVEGPGEITVLARKKQPKPPKVRPQRAQDTPSASAAEARRRRRRRRRKRRAMLPPKSAFTTPVLSTAAPIPEAQPRRSSGGGGPVIEYVRGPMRIASAPVASANPNDAGVNRRRGGGRNGRGGPPRRGWDRDRRFERGPAGGGGGGGPRPNGPGGFEGQQRPWPASPPGAEGRPPPEGEPGGERRRRRRRRRRRPGNGMPMQGAGGAPMLGADGSGPPPSGSALDGPANDAPVSFFAPTGAPMQFGPDGQPIRKRRRRRRRGRGGRQREWRATGPGGDGGGAPPASEGGGGGDGGAGPGDGGGGEP
jgi:ATP-dependent DNA helicase RecQ